MFTKIIVVATALVAVTRAAPTSSVSVYKPFSKSYKYSVYHTQRPGGLYAGLSNYGSSYGAGYGYGHATSYSNSNLKSYGSVPYISSSSYGHYPSSYGYGSGGHGLATSYANSNLKSYSYPSYGSISYPSSSYGSGGYGHATSYASSYLKSYDTPSYSSISYDHYPSHSYGSGENSYSYSLYPSHESSYSDYGSYSNSDDLSELYSVDGLGHDEHGYHY